MLTPRLTRSLRRRLAAGALACLGGAGGLAVLPETSAASTSQLAIIQDNADLTNPGAALASFRALGSGAIRVVLPWATLAPSFSSTHEPKFNATDPNAYPAGAWVAYDNLIRTAAADHITVDLTVTGGAPVWAEGPGIPASGRHDKYFAWKPNAADFGQFVQAAAKRYSGTFTARGGSSPLPAVHFWAIFNEPNFGEDLGPQAIDASRVSVAPMMLRGLLNSAWKALHGFRQHRHDTIIFGEFAARGIRTPGGYGQTKAGIYVRTLYCLDVNYRPLRGKLARQEGCPTTAAGTRRFRAGNPTLFEASGFSDHPYADNPGGSQKPTTDGLRGPGSDPNFATFPALPRFGREFDRAAAVYGAHPHFPIYNTEYGYITRPPQTKKYVSPSTAAWYLNWAEYISYKNPRIRSFEQYLLTDPPATAGPYRGFASGLLFPNGKPKATYYAYRMPLYMPHVSVKRNSAVEVWGAVRPAPFATLDGFGTQRVRIVEGSKQIATAKTGKSGYYDVRVKFAASGRIHTEWTYPSQSLLPSGFGGTTISSRSFPVTVH